VPREATLRSSQQTATGVLAVVSHKLQLTGAESRRLTHSSLPHPAPSQCFLVMQLNRSAVLTPTADVIVPPVLLPLPYVVGFGAVVDADGRWALSPRAAVDCEAC
jgi:hypothetical protein